MGSVWIPRWLRHGFLRVSFRGNGGALGEHALPCEASEAGFGAKGKPRREDGVYVMGGVFVALGTPMD